LPQRTSSLGLNEYLFYRGLGSGRLCYKEMIVLQGLASLSFGDNESGYCGASLSFGDDRSGCCGASCPE
jgi:hypothetical protein